MQLLKEETARKRIHNDCLVQIESPVTQDTVWHHSAKLGMLNSYRRDRIFNPQLTTIKNSYNKEMCNVWTFVTREYTNMRYLLSILLVSDCRFGVSPVNYPDPYLCYKNMISKCVCTFFFFFFYICKCVMSFSVLVFFSEFGQMHIKMFQKQRGSDSLIFKIWTSA